MDEIKKLTAIYAEEQKLQKELWGAYWDETFENEDTEAWLLRREEFIRGYGAAIEDLRKCLGVSA